jgi:hypothetical protein
MGELIQLRRHNEVVLMQALDLLRLQGDRRISPAEGDVRMVSFGFRQITSTLYEGKRLCKILKLKCSLDPLIAVEDSPFGGVAMMGFHLVLLSGGMPPRQGVQDLSTRDFGRDDIKEIPPKAKVL